ncbi:MAG: CvpA family protein [Clostridia bacterium]|nr:CvpA family protein [Clostridia bacterium]
MPWLDIILIAILLISALIGLKRGFFKTLINLCSTLITLVIAIWLAEPMCSLLDSWFGLSGALSNSITPTITGYCEGESLPWLVDKLAGLLLGADYATQYTINSPEFITALSDAVGHIIGVVISAIILFIVLKILLKLLSKIFDAITRNRSIKSLDKFLGFLLGALKGAVSCFSIFAITYLVGSALPFLLDILNPLLDNSTIGASFYMWVCDTLDTVILPLILG